MAAAVARNASHTPQPRPKPSPAHSTNSIHSSDNGKSSVPASTSGTISRKGSLQEDLTASHDSITPGVAKRPGLSSRLTRMFTKTHIGDSADKESDTKQQQAPSPTTTSPPNGQLKPDAPTRERSGSQSAHKVMPANGEIKSADSHAAPSAPPKKEDGAICPAHRRFIIKDDGTHEHFLKPDKRQEKLSDMFKNMLMGGRKKEEGQEHQLSLMSSWVDQVKNEKVANDAKGGPNYAHTLVEKYGKCQEVVGRGAFGIVRISHKTDHSDPRKEQLYAVKEFRRRPSESPKKYNKRLTSEFCISSALRHPNVIHTLDLMKDAKGDFCEVMEYCAGGDLYTLVLAAGKLEVVEADCYFKQLMRGVEYIHEMGVAHRDLKPENLLLTTHGSLKITDFGNGECFRMAWEQEPHMVAGLCGSAPYISPEEYTDSEFDPRAVDVWACGVIYMAMRTGRHLWRLAQKEEDEFYQKYLEGRRDEDGYGPIESLHRARCRNVIYSILDPNPSRRITASQVLKSEWGREIKLCKAGEEGF